MKKLRQEMLEKKFNEKVERKNREIARSVDQAYNGKSVGHKTIGSYSTLGEKNQLEPVKRVEKTKDHVAYLEFYHPTNDKLLWTFGPKMTLYFPYWDLIYRYEMKPPDLEPYTYEDMLELFQIVSARAQIDEFYNFKD